jgi:hypothetical protein
MKTVFYGVIAEEKVRNLERQELYQKEIEKLPKGFIVERVRGRRTYYYLQHRNGRAMSVKYLKKGTDIGELQKRIAERKHLEGIVKRLRLEYKQMCRIVKD